MVIILLKYLRVKMMEVGIDIRRQKVLDVKYTSSIIYNYIKYFKLIKF